MFENLQGIMVETKPLCVSRVCVCVCVCVTCVCIVCVSVFGGQGIWTVSVSVNCFTKALAAKEHCPRVSLIVCV